MFKKRVLSSILLIIIALLTLIYGGNLLFFTIFLISLIGLYEFYKAVKVQNEKMGILSGVGYLCATMYFAILFFNQETYTIELIILWLILLLAVYVFTFPKYKAKQVFSTFFGLFYVPIMLFYVYQTRMIADGVYLVWLILICSWGCDTCAYCVGMLFGKHKLAPLLSPKKSIEGAIGGIAGAALLGAIYAVVVNNYLESGKNTIIIYAIICAVGAVISQVGDLAASAIKRNHDIKDYGNLIPGHGGILDRFDSVIFTAPVIYFLARTLL
jgi:CDP-diglyceride synthetase